MLKLICFYLYLSDVSVHWDGLKCPMHYTPTQWGHYHHGMFRQSGTYDEMSGFLGRWLSMTTGMGVYLCM